MLFGYVIVNMAHNNLSKIGTKQWTWSKVFINTNMYEVTKGHTYSQHKIRS